MVHSARALPPHQLHCLRPHRGQLLLLPSFLRKPVWTQRLGSCHQGARPHRKDRWVWVQDQKASQASPCPSLPSLGVSAPLPGCVSRESTCQNFGCFSTPRPPLCGHTHSQSDCKRWMWLTDHNKHIRVNHANEQHPLGDCTYAKDATWLPTS